MAKIRWSAGLMDKASASGAGDSRFESWVDHVLNREAKLVIAATHRRIELKVFGFLQHVAVCFCDHAKRFQGLRERSLTKFRKPNSAMAPW